MELSRQEYWSGLPFPSPGDLPDPRIEPVSLVSSALTVGFFTTSTTWEVTLNSGILQIDALLHFLTTMEIFIEIGASVC